MAERDRREVLAGATAMAAATALSGAARAKAAWDTGPARYILPAASDRAFRIKTAFRAPLERPPVLKVGRRRVEGSPTGPGGRYWGFDADGLEPDRAYTLQILSGGQGNTGRWRLRTCPAPDSQPAKLRMLVFTCAGGDEDAMRDGRRSATPLAVRRALLARGLDFQPDAVLAIGDHVYWDQESGRRRNGGDPGELQRRIGLLSDDPGSPRNEEILAVVGERQIAGLYGVSLRSTPAWFVRDDHDYFENDEFYGDRATFPPSGWMRGLTDRLQRMFWPEFLPDPNRPPTLPGEDRSFGTLRWGRLAEALIYDCRGHMSAAPQGAFFIPPAVEAWIAARSADRRVRHTIQVPSTPWGWTAGKWGEWYPDVIGPGGLGTDVGKRGWRPEWRAQHQRLLALAGSRGRDVLSISGDLHAVGAARILRYGDVSPAHGVHSLLSGPLGSEDLAFPSAFRGTPPKAPVGMELETHLAATEKNGFTIVDLTERGFRVRQFTWRSPQSAALIPNLVPVLDRTITA